VSPAHLDEHAIEDAQQRICVPLVPLQPLALGPPNLSPHAILVKAAQQVVEIGPEIERMETECIGLPELRRPG